MLDNDENIKKALVTLCIEKTLLDIGKPVYDKAMVTLNAKYHCYLPDCYDHPEYLDEILKKLFGDASSVIVKSITKELEEYNQNGKIERFLEVICH